MSHAKGADRRSGPDIDRPIDTPGAAMNLADLLVFLLANAPVVIAVTLFLTATAIVASVSGATPGGPRTMDPAASWR
jgi:hypothetical protein